MDVIGTDVGRSGGVPVIRSTAPPSSVGASTGSAAQGTNLVSAMFEHALASLARFETRMDDFDRRLVPPHSGPAQSFGLPSHWFTDSLPQSQPISIPTQLVLTSIPNPPGPLSSGPPRSVEHSGPATQPWAIPPPLSMAGQLGNFGGESQIGSGTGQGLALSSWAPPGTGQGLAFTAGRQPTSWDNPTWHNNGSQQAWEEPRDVKMKPPRFNGTDAVNWIARAQYYFDHLRMPEAYRRHYAVMLFENQAAEWVFNYRASNPVVLWNDFLEDVRRRFDPQCFKDYLGLIAKLVQTGSLTEYNATFESMRNQISNVPETTFLPIYVAGLRQPIRSQVKHQHPRSVAAAIALAMEFDGDNDKSVAQSGPSGAIGTPGISGPNRRVQPFHSNNPSRRRDRCMPGVPSIQSCRLFD